MHLSATLLTGLLASGVSCAAVQGGLLAGLVMRQRRILPVNGDTVIDLGVLEPGRLDYSCGMGMYTGRLTVQAAS